jgi:alginate O-acetyltransferase complex protein AlgJ
MYMMNNIYLRFFYLLLIGALFSLPLMQLNFNIFPAAQLHGVENNADRPTLSLANISNGEYQKKADQWINQHFGLRDFFVKTSNQFYYSLFNETPPNNSIVVGKENQLYINSYITDYLNIIPPLDPNVLEKKVKEIKALQDALKEIGKTYIVLITPSKAAIYPEYIPNQFTALRGNSNRIRNYDVIIPLLNKYGINYIDGHQITMDHKSESEVFPRGGIHWNWLAAFYTTKHTIDKLSDLSGKKLNNFEVNKVTMSTPTDIDRDLADLLNLWSTPVNYKVPHLEYSFIPNGTDHKPSVLMEGGSFSFQVMELMNIAKVYKNLDFYLYYHDHWIYKEGQPGTNVGLLQNVNLKNEIMEHDIIISEMNEQYITKIQNGFIQDVLYTLKPININLSPANPLVEKSNIDGKDGFIIRKGDYGNIHLNSQPLDLEPNQEYTLSYKAKGYYLLRSDFYPDDLPQFNNDKITDDVKEFSFTFSSDSKNMQNSTLRFFIDGINMQTDKDTYLYDIKLVKNIKK